MVVEKFLCAWKEVGNLFSEETKKGRTMGTNNVLTENLSSPERSKVILHFYPSSLAGAGNLSGKVFYPSYLFLVDCYWSCDFVFIFIVFYLFAIYHFICWFCYYCLLSYTPWILLWLQYITSTLSDTSTWRIEEVNTVDLPLNKHGCLWNGLMACFCASNPVATR